LSERVTVGTLVVGGVMSLSFPRSSPGNPRGGQEHMEGGWLREVRWKVTTPAVEVKIAVVGCGLAGPGRPPRSRTPAGHAAPGILAVRGGAGCQPGGASARAERHPVLALGGPSADPHRPRVLSSPDLGPLSSGPDGGVPRRGRLSVLAAGASLLRGGRPDPAPRGQLQGEAVTAGVRLRSAGSSE
jgi:hypothetical protein